MNNKLPDKGAVEAFKEAGGQTQLARKLTDHIGQAVETSRVHKWKYNGIPPHFVLPVEAVTNVSRHILRPDLYPEDSAA